MADELMERLVRELAALRARVAALERQEGLTSPVGTQQIADGAVTAAKIAGGPGSGVHADMLDNQHLSDLDSRYVNVSGDTMTGALVVDNDVGPGDSRTYCNLASYKDYGNPAIGTMKITLPKSWSNTMMRIRIVGYDFTSNSGWEATISGYNYEPSQSWIYTAAELRGNTPFSTVRLAHDGTKNCILLGDTTTEWGYPHVVVSEMLASYGNITGWETGWDISIITDESGITNITTPPIRKFWHSENDGHGSGLDADSVDGKHLSDLDSRYVNVSGDTMTGALAVDNDVGPSDSRIYYNLASYKDYGNPAIGTMKITLPKSWSSTMMRIRIVGYDFTSNSGWEATISGYNYAPEQGWVYTAAELRGNTPFATVRLAHDGTKNCILLGNTTTAWKYPHVVVSEMLASYGNITGWETGWDISIITDESGITNITTPPIRKFWHSGNDGSGSGLDADKLDGLEASALRGLGAIVKRTTTQTIPNDTTTVVSFDTELVDIGNCFDPNQPDRITVPTSGVYYVWGQVRWVVNTNGVRDINIRIGGTDYVMTSRTVAYPNPAFLHISGIWYLQSGQIVQMTAYQTSGGNLNIEPVNGQYISLGVFRLY